MKRQDGLEGQDGPDGPERLGDTKLESSPSGLSGPPAYPARLFILYSPIFRVSVLRCMPSVHAVFVRLPSH